VVSASAIAALVLAGAAVDVAVDVLAALVCALVVAAVICVVVAEADVLTGVVALLFAADVLLVDDEPPQALSVTANAKTLSARAAVLLG
jgi:hypothetical protein